jgi:hypothetical protein
VEFSKLILIAPTQIITLLRIVVPEFDSFQISSDILESMVRIPSISVDPSCGARMLSGTKHNRVSYLQRSRSARQGFWFQRSNPVAWYVIEFMKLTKRQNRPAKHSFTAIMSQQHGGGGYKEEPGVAVGSADHVSSIFMKRVLILIFASATNCCISSHNALICNFAFIVSSSSFTI